MKNIFGIIIFSLVFCSETGDEVGFSYGILGRLKSQDEKITVLQDSSIIQTGDSVRINVGYHKETHLYVLYKGAQGEYMLIYPEEGSLIGDVADLPTTLYSTVLHWSEFSDPTGYETFYLINSNFVLNELIKLMKRYDKVNPKGRIKVAKLIENELADLDPENKQDLASVATRLDKPVLGGVAFRGDEDGIKDVSLTHTCIGKFGIAFKQIILNHQ